EDGGAPYLVLEFVSGPSLERVLKERGRLPEREALEIMADVARGLVGAHERGVVHRDVKPGNILLRRKSEIRNPKFEGASDFGFRISDFEAKLSDFGLARHVIQTESLELTRAGTVLGTPLYMSPEQCAGTVVD